jgi:hypothetical protein
MPLAKIHVLEGRYDERRLSNVSKAVQDALISILKIPYASAQPLLAHAVVFRDANSDDFIVLELAFISGGPEQPERFRSCKQRKEKRT